MANPAWFDEYTYLASKLNQLKSAGVTTYSTINQVKAAIEAAGWTTYNHFSAYSLAERTSPNQYFNTNEYLAAKAKQLGGTWTAEKVALAFQTAGFNNAYDHFAKYGWAENVNPSNAFDVSAYFDLKVKQTGMTLDQVKAAFAAAGLDPISHYETYGKSETGISVTAVPTAEQVAADTTSGSAGQTFTLTNGLDNIVGTSGNDTILAGTQAAAATLTAGDQINGGDGTDTLKIYDGIANFATATVKGVEIVEDYSGAGAINVSGNADVKEIWLNKASVNAATAAKTQIIGFGDAAGGAAAVATFDAAAGSADSATVALKDAGKTTAYTSIAVAGIEALTIDAAGKNQLGNLIAASAETIAIKGAGSVKATLVPGTTVLKSVDAAANTGGVDLTLTDAQFGTATEIKVTGGTGGDKIKFTDALGVKSTIDLGDGSNTLTITQGGTALTAASTFKAGSGSDTLVLDTTTAIDATSGKMFTGFENIKLSGASSYTVGHIAGITGYEIASGAATSATISSLANAADVKISASSTGTQTLTLADNSAATSAVNVSLDNSAAVTAASGAAQLGISTLIDTNAHVLNFASNGTVATASVNKVNLTGMTNSLAQITNIMITGSQAAELTTDAATALTLIDGFSATGALKITATNAAKSMTIKGGEGKDTIVATDVATAISTIIGGKGADTITLGATDANNKGDVIKLTAQTDSTAAGFDIVTEFTGGGTDANRDFLDLKAFGFTGAQAAHFTLGAAQVTTAGAGATATFTISDANAKDFFANAGVDKAVALYSNTATETFAFIDADKNGDWNAASDSVVLLVGAYNAAEALDAAQIVYA